MRKCSGVVVSDLFGNVRNVRNLSSVMRAQRSQRSKEEVLTECAQILFAAWMQEDDLQKLVELLLVTSIVRERT